MIKHISDQEYFALEGVSNSLLSRLAKCPANLLTVNEPTPQMMLGTLAHCLILEGRDEFDDRYAVAPECDRRTKAGKEIWEEFNLMNPDKTVITLEQLQAVAGMAASVASHPSARQLLIEGDPEMAVTWEEDGLKCKAKCDWLSPTALIDLKTCQDSSYPIFSKTVINMGYAKQFAFYRSGLKANGCFPSESIIIAVESKAPFTVNVYSLSDEVLEFGEGQYKPLLEKYRQIQNTDVYEAYTYAGIHEIRLPQWLKETE